MSFHRPAVILLTTVALLCPGAAAWAASSTLTPAPPVALTQPTATPSPAPQPSVPSATTGPRPAVTIPRTGSDLPLEVLVAMLLITAGAILRTRRPVGRA
jgi:hypothetical protein